MQDTIQTIAVAVGLSVGITYIIGGFIVILHLSYYGVMEYQFLQVKYLVVGLIYLLNTLSILIFSTILIAISILLIPASRSLITIGIPFISLLSTIFLAMLWSRERYSVQTPLLHPLFVWIILSSLAAMFPLIAMYRFMFVPSTDITLEILNGLAIVSGVFALIIQLYYYARQIYGNPRQLLGERDAIGMGLPQTVYLVGDSAHILQLTHVGVAALGTEMTDQVLLLDETDTHYIIGIPLDQQVRAIKIAKDTIKAILYLGKTAAT